MKMNDGAYFTLTVAIQKGFDEYFVPILEAYSPTLLVDAWMAFWRGGSAPGGDVAD